MILPPVARLALTKFAALSSILKYEPAMAPYFCRKIKLKYKFVSIIFVGVLYILFQIKWIEELTEQTPVRGIHSKVAKFYVRDRNNQFTCLHDGQVIEFSKVNDDYCDCDDGTDEPGTSACPNGIFYCTVNMYSRAC